MSVRYAILKHYEAMPGNTQAHRVENWLTGKGGMTITHGKEDLSTDELIKNMNGLDRYFLREYGYTTRASASRGLKASKDTAEWETNMGHWKVSAELIELEV